LGLAFLEGAEAGPDLLLGPLADGAGVEQEDVGAFGLGGEAVAQGREGAGDELGVELVHLAAEGLEIDGPVGHTGDGRDLGPNRSEGRFRVRWPRADSVRVCHLSRGGVALWRAADGGEGGAAAAGRVAGGLEHVDAVLP